jgi:hypothetical protein
MLVSATAWLGGELVDRLGVGVDDGANLNAPSSLTAQSARGPVGRTRDRRTYPPPAYPGTERRAAGLAR